jgi:secondary thiamine-phosphate synthase enzyme
MRAHSMIDQHVFQSVASFRSYNDTLSYETSNAPQFIDITGDVTEVLDQSGIVNGLAVIFSMHTTAAIKINESEPELLKDMARFLSEIAPHDREYFHNNFDVRTVNMEEDECPNAHSHCQHLMLSASETVPVVNGRLCLGRWQRIFLVELDRPKARRVNVQLIGM